MRSLITVENYLTSDGKYPERSYSKELCLDYRLNAGRLCEAVNTLFKDLNLPIPTINSGFRTQAANAACGGSRLSAHCIAAAIDLNDTDGSLYRNLALSIPLLEKHGLYMESSPPTVGWTHLTIRVPSSLKRIFHP